MFGDDLLQGEMDHRLTTLDQVTRHVLGSWHSLPCLPRRHLALVRLPDIVIRQPDNYRGAPVRVIGPDFIALQVSDLEVSAAFYSEQLGLERAAQSPPGAVVFATTPIPLCRS